ncbi:MAG: HIT family protein [Thermofilaceae archaeon]
MKKCIFCAIVAGEAPAYIIYRTTYAMAFLDIYPVSKGHTLIASNYHYRDILETPDDVLTELVRLAKAIARAQREALGAEGVRLIQNNGSIAGQEIFHIHFHVIPYYPGTVHSRRLISIEEGNEISKKLSKSLRLD